MKVSMKNDIDLKVVDAFEVVHGSPLHPVVEATAVLTLHTCWISANPRKSVFLAYCFFTFFLPAVIYASKMFKYLITFKKNINSPYGDIS